MGTRKQRICQGREVQIEPQQEIKMGKDKDIK